MFDGGRKARLDAPARLFLLMLVPAVALRLPQPMAVRHVRLFFCSALDGGAGPKPKALPPALALAEWAPHVRDMLRPLGDASCVPREVRHMLDAAGYDYDSDYDHDYDILTISTNSTIEDIDLD